MNTKYIVITLLLVFTAFMAAPVFAIEAGQPGVVIDPLSFDRAEKAVPAESSAPSGTPAGGRRDIWDPLNNNEDSNSTGGQDLT
jgi:hypothetical protein